MFAVQEEVKKLSSCSSEEFGLAALHYMDHHELSDEQMQAMEKVQEFKRGLEDHGTECAITREQAIEAVQFHMSLRPHSIYLSVKKEKAHVNEEVVDHSVFEFEHVKADDYLMIEHGIS